MSTAVVLIVIFVFAAALIGVGLGLARRSARQTQKIAEQLGLPKREDLAPLPESLDVELVPPELTVPEAPAPELTVPGAAAPVVERPRLRERLGKTRAVLSGWRRRSAVDEETWNELEESLILADVGVATTQGILEHVRARATEARVDHPAVLVELLKRELVGVLADGERGLRLDVGEPNVWLFVGVNGVGKTTTIAKLARQQVEAGHKVVLAAADTFRAAAAEQLGHWAEQVGADLVRGQEGADPGSVVFDAMSAAGTRSADLVLVDTAGRLHTKVNLMEELKKIRRIVDRTPGACKEVLLVLDASTGQNAVAQARQFTEAVDVTGVVLTKLDGTSKGGIVLAIQSELGIPVKVVGIGESASDLVPFDPKEFVDALFE